MAKRNTPEVAEEVIYVLSPEEFKSQDREELLQPLFEGFMAIIGVVVAGGLTLQVLAWLGLLN